MYRGHVVESDELRNAWPWGYGIIKAERWGQLLLMYVSPCAVQLSSTSSDLSPLFCFYTPQVHIPYFQEDVIQLSPFFYS